MIRQIVCSSSKAKLLTMVLVLLAALLFLTSACCQSAPSIRVGGVDITGIPDDWTHHHLIFAGPGGEQEAIASGRYAQWQIIVNTPRYVLQQLKRNLPVQGPAAVDAEYRASWIAEAGRSGESALLGALGDNGLVGGSVNRGQRPVTLRKPVFGPPINIEKDWNVSLVGPGLAAGQYPAKYSASTTASCSDYLVLPTGAAGSSTQASIVAYNNLYLTTCSANPPAVYWAYNTGGTSNLSPVVSWDGTQIAFMQKDNSTGHAELVLLHMAASGGSVAAPASINAVPNANYHSCTTPCYTTIPLNGGPTDTGSAPFYDYGSDTIYVGDDAGRLHKITGIFGGTLNPAEVTTSWPVTVVSGKALTGPVYDAVSKHIYAGVAGGATSYLAEVAPAGGSATLSHSIAGGTNDIAQPPIIDSTDHFAYVFLQGAASNSIQQFSIGASGFASGTTAAYTATFGTGGTNPLYIGDFDDNFYSSETGYLYSCANTGGAATVYRLAITAGAMGTTATAGPALTSAASACSPATEIYNSAASGGPHDWIFAGVTGSGAQQSCSGGGCVLGMEITEWMSGHGYAQASKVIDSNFNLEVATSAGTLTSGSSAPAWVTTIGSTVTDGTAGLTWTNEGPFTLTGFQSDNTYAANQVIVDSNNNIERVTTCGIIGCNSAGTAPAWSTTFGDTTTSCTGSIFGYCYDGATFTNQGPAGIIGQAFTGGTSGIIIDNIGAAAGESNIYFSTLNTPSSAVQASQCNP